MGKYTQFMYDNHFFNVDYGPRPGAEVSFGPKSETTIQAQTDPARSTLPKDPALVGQAACGHWIGDLVTWSWTQPIDDVRQVARLDEEGVDVWEWGGIDDGGTGQKRDPGPQDYWYNRMCPYLLAFRDVTPELGRFMGDYLKPEKRGLLPAGGGEPAALVRHLLRGGAERRDQLQLALGRLQPVRGPRLEGDSGRAGAAAGALRGCPVAEAGRPVLPAQAGGDD